MKSQIILSAISLLAMLHCAGSRGTIRFDKLRHPVSASGYLEPQPGKVSALDREFVLAERFEYRYRHWAIGYTLVPLTNTDELPRRLSDAIEKAEGIGAVNLRFQISSCTTNTIPVLSLIPVFPGCTEVVMRADIVRGK